MFNTISNWLKNQGIIFKTCHHEATLTSEDSAKARGDNLSIGAKAIILKVQDNFYNFVLPANLKINPKLIKGYFKNKGLKAKKIRFATKEELLSLTGLVPGSIPPFGNPILQLELFVDNSLFENIEIAFNAGSLENSITMKSEDFKKISNPTIFPFSDRN